MCLGGCDQRSSIFVYVVRGKRLYGLLNHCHHPYMPSFRSLPHRQFITPLTLHKPVPSGYRTYADNVSQPERRASTKLFEDAANEEAELAEQATRESKIEALQTRHENWTGEESVQDAVLRMLVDKYKPLRSGPIRTADEKLKKSPPRVGLVEASTFDALASNSRDMDNTVVVRTTWGPTAGPSLADVPLLPSIEGHQPWQTTFTVPSHARSSIKYGNIPPSPTASRLPPNPELLDEKARRKLRETKKRTEQAGRLRNAKESTLDYRLGISGRRMADGGTVYQRPNPVGLKGWASLVEDRIEVRSPFACVSPLTNLYAES